MAEEKNELTDETLDGVAGGRMSDTGNCPYCGSDNKEYIYEHDEIAVFNCKNWGERFQYRFG